MAAKTKTLTFRRLLHAPPTEVYRAVTNSTALRGWFCNAAMVDPHKGGRFYVRWSHGYYASGEFTALEPGKKVALIWHGRGEPEATRVQVSLTPKNDDTALTITHSGLGTGKAWAKATQAMAASWAEALENLQSVLETGLDLRFTRRPMLGLNGGDELTPHLAAALGVPVTEGIRLDGFVEGMGAQAAGLRKDDVVVGFAGKKIRGWQTLISAVQAQRAGDTIPVTFYRGKEKLQRRLTLSARPLPELPATLPDLTEALRRLYTTLDAELAQCFEGVSEAEAGYSPGPNEWSAKEVLAHLIVDERDRHAAIDELINGEERWYDGFAGQIQVRHKAVVTAYATLPALLEELKRHEIETVALVAALPAEFAARKSSYWRLCSGLFQLAAHPREHMRQIRAAIQAARQS